MLCLLSLPLGAQDSAVEIQREFDSAARIGDLVALKQLLLQGAQINSPGGFRTALGFAAASGRLEVIQFLVENGARINQEDYFKKSPLEWAAEAGQVEAVKLLVENGAQIERNGKRTPLISAIKRGHGAVVEWLVKSGAVTCARVDAESQSPLAEAIESKQLAIIKLLLVLGADPNAPDRNGRNSLCKAVSLENLEAAEILLRDGMADPNAGSSPALNALAWRDPNHRETPPTELVNLLLRYGAELNPARHVYETPLMAAVSSVDLQLCRLLLNSGALVDHPNSDGRTPLHLAIERGREDTTQFLLEAGADPLKKDLKGVNPLALSIRNGNITIFTLLRTAAPKALIEPGDLVIAASRQESRMVRHLIQLGVDPTTARDKEGNSLLHAALELGGDAEFVKYLLTEARVDPNAVNGNGVTALMTVCRNGSLDIAKLLVAHGAKVDLSDHYGSTALHEAIQAQDPEVLAWVLPQTLQLVNRGDGWGRRPAHHAAEKSDALPLLRLLVKAGANLELRDSDGESVLHVAARNSNRSAPEEAVVRYLIEERHVSPQIADNYGRTPLLEAAGSGNEACTRYLMDYGGWGATDKFGNGLLHLAARSGMFSIVKTLANQKDFEVDHPDGDGYTPMLLGAGHPEIFAFLWQKGANPNVRSKDGETPLLRAASYAVSSSLELLFSNPQVREQINVRSPKGDTPLLRLFDKRWSKSENLGRSLRILLENGADPRVRNTEGKDASVLAKDLGDPALISMLQ